MDAQDHAMMAAVHKAELDKQSEDLLKEDVSVHEANMKKAQMKREEAMTELQDTLLHSDIVDHQWHANKKAIEDHKKEEALNRDVRKHEERLKRAAQHQQELAEKMRADTEQLQHSVEEHQQRAALRHAAAVPE